MEEKTISCIYIENSLRGYCHVKKKVTTIRHKVLRSLKTLKKKTWYSPVKSIITFMVVLTALILLIDLVSYLMSNV